MVSKCEHCKTRKISLATTFECRCELKKLCMTCRYPEAHNCSYDFRVDGKEQLEKTNPLVVKEKILKI
jgi:hypothetical protein